MSTYILAIVILSQPNNISIAYVFYIAIFVFIYWLSSSAQLQVVLLIALLQSRKQSPPGKVTVIYRKNQDTSLRSSPSVTSRNKEKLIH